MIHIRLHFYHSALLEIFRCGLLEAHQTDLDVFALVFTDMRLQRKHV